MHTLLSISFCTSWKTLHSSELVIHFSPVGQNPFNVHAHSVAISIGHANQDQENHECGQSGAVQVQRQRNRAYWGGFTRVGICVMAWPPSILDLLTAGLDLHSSVHSVRSLWQLFWSLSSTFTRRISTSNGQWQDNMYNNISYGINSFGLGIFFWLWIDFFFCLAVANWSDSCFIWWVTFL